MSGSYKLYKVTGSDDSGIFEVNGRKYCVTNIDADGELEIVNIGVDDSENGERVLNREKQYKLVEAMNKLKEEKDRYSPHEVVVLRGEYIKEILATL